MRWRLQFARRRRSDRQRLLPFYDRSEQLERRFKSGIAALTVMLAIALVASSGRARLKVAALGEKLQESLERQMGLEPDRQVVEAQWRLRRAAGVAQARASLEQAFKATTPEMRTLLRTAGMAPENGVLRWGRAEQAFLVSSRVFAQDDHGRSYRLLPDRRSIWLRQLTLKNGPFMLLLVPNTPEVRAAAGDAGGVIDEASAQTTNSWGCRGPEPDTSAPARGLVLGDSYMQGMFVGDADTPSMNLERALRKRWGVPVSILNTGVLGYSPEQYYYTLLEYGDRFRPDFVVISVCPNDFGDTSDVIFGKGDWWDEAAYWLEQIALWCRARRTLCLLVPVPTEDQLTGKPKDAAYPGRVADLFRGSALDYCNPFDRFVTEHARLMQQAARKGSRPQHSPLFNGHIADNHFSAAGCALWGQEVADRVAARLDRPDDR